VLQFDAFCAMCSYFKACKLVVDKEGFVKGAFCAQMSKEITVKRRLTGY